MISITMKSNILKILSGLLIMALGLSVFCVVMIYKKTENDEEITQIVTSRIVTETGTAQTMSFDGLLAGTGSFVSKSMKIGEVPCVLYYADNYLVRPVIIIQHGLTSSKEDMKDLASAFAQQGYLVITPDAAAHGELKDDSAYSLAELIQKTSEDFDVILQYVSESNYIDMDRIGIAGISLGGLSAMYYVKNGSYDPKVVVSMCATPKFEDLAGTDAAYHYMKSGSLVAERDEEKLTQLDQALTAISPYESIFADKKTIYYLLCGDKDQVVPYQGNLELYEAKPEAENLVLKVKEGQGHEVTEEDMWEILTYVVEHL